ncbi:MAG: hypothetical protein U5L96_07600 [Owenweeksia sp.]|nr:hypothetical protein [Owenweeksia sp.]
MPGKPGLTTTLHNQHLLKMLELLESERQDLLIKTPGRHADEDGFAYLEQGRLTGMGFIPRNLEVKLPEELNDFIIDLRNSITTQGILDKVLTEGKYQVMRF